MGYYIYPAHPGTENGPCADDCIHEDCAAMRADAERICRICGTTIGYDNKIYFEAIANDGETKSIVHAICLWEEQEKPKAK